MEKQVLRKWMVLSFFSLFLVALLGVLMRYKIGFSLPLLNQKNLQHAHSHFAFGGWITQTLFLFLLHSLGDKIDKKRIRLYNYLLMTNWMIALGMLVAFAVQGYAFYSILFSSLSIVISFVFARLFWKDAKHHPNKVGIEWFRYSLIFMVISTLGTLSLMYMMVSKSLEQHTYLASVYWYLHFQYNGWFFFACMGLLFSHFGNLHSYFTANRLALRLLAVSCLPAYGLSVLWLDLPIWIVIVIAIAASVQAMGWFLLLFDGYKSKVIKSENITPPIKWLLIIIIAAGSVKFGLQLASTVPAVSQLAFGFRPIVIAYLHLVLLAFISLLLIAYSFMTEIAKMNKTAFIGIVIFVVGILFNELLLGLQGVLSLSYIVVPHINLFLFLASLLLIVGSIILLISQLSSKY